MPSINPVIQVRVNPSVKEAAMCVAAGIGIPLTTLVHAFITRLAWEGRVPFELASPQSKYSHETLAAFAEADAIADGTAESEPVDIDKFFKEMGA